MKHRRFGIRFELFGLVLLLVLTVVVASSFFTVQFETELLERERTHRGRVISRNWARICTEMLQSGDALLEPGMYDFIDDNLETEEGMSSIFLLDSAGRVLVHDRTSMLSRVLDDSLSLLSMTVERDTMLTILEKDKETLFHFMVPIFGLDRERLGTARVILNDRGIREAIREGLVRQWILAGISILVGLMGSFLISLKIMWPIRRLADGVEEIGKGNLEHEIDLKLRNELGDLAKSFNQMVRNLKAAQEDIVNKTRIETELRIRAEELIRLATSDELTGLFNKRQFNTDISRFIARFERYGEPFSMLFLDMDHFKKLNDTEGHKFGDRALHHLSEAVRACIRRGVDLAYRFGGDEFIVLFAGSEAEFCQKTGHRIGLRYEELKDEKNISTISFGVVTYTKGESSDEFFKRADAAMYAAKNAKKAKR